jgi:hypothetical protein
MSKVEQIEGQIKELSSEELTAFRRWFAEFDAEVWDRQFETDVKAGKLVSLAGYEVHKSIKFLFSLAPKGQRESEGPCQRGVLLTATLAGRRDWATLRNSPSPPTPLPRSPTWGEGSRIFMKCRFFTTPG